MSQVPTHEIVERFREAAAALQARIAELEKERELRHSQFDACVGIERSNCERALVALAGARIPTPVEGYGTNTSWAISDLIRGLGELRTRAEAAEKLAGDAVEALKELRDGVELPDRRCDPVSVTGEHRFIIDRVLSSPAAEQAQERAEAIIVAIAAIRSYRRFAVIAEQVEGEQYKEAESAEETLDAALQRLDALDTKGERARESKRA